MMNELMELKAQAYDCLVAIQNAQEQLKQVNERIVQALRAQAEKESNVEVKVNA